MPEKQGVSFFSAFLSTLQSNFFNTAAPLTSRQKTIAAIAAAIFASVALAAFVYRLFVPKSINIVTHEEIHNRISIPFVQSDPQTTIEKPSPQVHPLEQVVHHKESEQLPSFEIKTTEIIEKKAEEKPALDMISGLQISDVSDTSVTIHIDAIPYPIYIRIKPDFFTDIELSTERLLDYAMINYRNTTCVEDARIILMGERHATPKHQDLEVAIINQFGNDGDVFLLEGIEYEPFIPDEFSNCAIYRNISKNIHMSGWEESLSPLINMLKIVKGIDSKKAEYLNEKKRYEDNLSPNQENMQKKWDEFSALFCQFNQIVNERNNFLIRSIKRALTEHPHSKIFVMAGKWHILASETDGLVAPFNLLDHMPENEKCAALLFKD